MDEPVDRSPVLGDVTQEVCRIFGLGDVVDGPDHVARGAMGEIWRVRTEVGRFALKELFPWVDFDPLPFDVEVQQVALDSGIRMPAPVITEGEAVRSVSGRHFRAYEWADLGDELQPPVGASRAREVGRTLARLHRLDIDVPAGTTVDSWYRTPPHPERFDELHAEAQSLGEPWAVELSGARGIIDELASLVDERQGPVAVCHRDFDPSNVLPGRHRDELIVLDWENVGPLAIDQELAATLHAWTTSRTIGATDVGSARQLLDAYHRGGGPADLDGARSFSMSVCTALNFLVVMAEQSLDTRAEERHRDFGRQRVNELLGRDLRNLLHAIPALAAIE